MSISCRKLIFLTALQAVLTFSAVLPAFSDSTGIYHEGWIDLNKNGRKDPYEDPAVAGEKRIDDLL